MDADPAIKHVLRRNRRWALLQGDCVERMRQLPAESIDAVVTDPPYGISYRGLEDRRPPIANDERPFIWWLAEAYRVVKDGGALVCFTAWKHQEDFRTAIRIAGFHVASQVIWDRVQPGMGNTACTFAPRHDIIWFATKGRFRFPNGRPPSVLAHNSVPATRRLHSTQKPDGLMGALVRAVTPEGGVILDPCTGSGSTGDAALRAGYRFIGYELDPGNFAVARDRLRAAHRVRACEASLIHVTEAEAA